MNRLQKLTEKSLKLILRMIYNSVESYGRPSNIFDYANDRLIREELDLINLKNLDYSEMSFILQLYKSNPNYETEPLKLPKLGTFEVKTRRIAELREKQWWVMDYESFLEDPDDVNIFLAENDDYDWWDGEMIDSESYDEETLGTEIDDVKKIS